MNTLSKILLVVIIISSIVLGFSLCSALVAEVLNWVAVALTKGADLLASVSGQGLKWSIIVLALSIAGFVAGFVGLSGKE